MGSSIWYATREDVKSALDFKETARNDRQVDRAIAAASRSIDGGDQIGGLLKRRFYPTLATRYFDWPNGSYAYPYRLWLDEHEVISVTALVSGGQTISSGNYFLSPYDGPPYDCVEINLSTDSAFIEGNSNQRTIAITGVFGSSADTEDAGALDGGLNDSTTAVLVTDSSLLGVGDVIQADTEWMIVKDKLMSATGVSTSTALDAKNNTVTVTVSSTTGAPLPGEVILIGSERMLVVDAVGATLTVKRAWDGSVLAAHDSGTGVSAPRTLKVVRGQLGTTAASHADEAPLVRNVPPGLVHQLCVAEAVSGLLNESSGYARTAGSGDNAREAAGRALNDLRAQAKASYGRMGRIRAV